MNDLPKVEFPKQTPNSQVGSDDIWDLFHLAIEANNKERVIELAHQYPEELNAWPPNDKNSHLQSACKYGRYSIAAWLLKNGALINYQTKIGSSPLTRAAYLQNASCVYLLLVNGADVNLKGNGQTAEQWARGSSKRVFEWFHQAGQYQKQNSSLLLAARFKNPESLFYHENCPLDIFKLIFKLACLVAPSFLKELNLN